MIYELQTMAASGKKKDGEDADDRDGTHGGDVGAGKGRCRGRVVSSGTEPSLVSWEGVGCICAGLVYVLLCSEIMTWGLVYLF